MGGSSSSSKSKSVTETQNIALDNVSGVTLAGHFGNTSVNVTETDYGAIDRAFDFAENAGGQALQFGRDTLSFADSVVDGGYQFVSDFTDRAISALQNTSETALDLVSQTKDTESQRTVETLSKVAIAAAIAWTLAKIFSRGK